MLIHADRWSIPHPSLRAGGGVLGTLALLLALHATTAQAAAGQGDASQTLLIGTWTDAHPEQVEALTDPAHSKGLYRAKLNADGSIDVIDAVPLPSPSWTAWSADKRFVYVTNEDNNDAPGHVSALQRQPDGSLKPLDTVESHGQQPTHAALSPDGKFLFVSNYSARPAHAGVAVFAIDAQGGIGRLVQDIPFIRGDNANPERQKDGHAHSVTFTPDGRVAYVADLGSDVMRAYRYEPAASQPLNPWPQRDVHFSPGSGPRHLLFAADGRHAYATTEMGAQIIVFRVDNDQLIKQQQLDLTVNKQADARGGAGMVFSPDQRFLYVSNRRNTNEILAYAVDQRTGNLRQIGRYPAGGKEPRTMAIDATGRYLLVSNVFSNNVTEFVRDQADGTLRRSKVTLNIGAPTDVKFFP